MKRLISIAAVIVLIAVALVAGYKAGIERAVTADVWIQGGMIYMDLEGNLYCWYADTNDLEGGALYAVDYGYQS